ncbi:MAG: hypothetical protein JKY65_14835 [Planctomycetes bacterium]|nr:hypothetical protein [Planctomycetota bacterium]
MTADHLSDTKLEDLMSCHLELVTPSPKLREVTRARVHERLDASPSDQRSGSAKKPSARRRKKSKGSSGSRQSGSSRKGFNPIVAISALSAAILISMGLFLLVNQAPPPAVNENLDWGKAKRLEEEGMAAYGAFLVARREGQPDLTEQRRQEAIDKLRAAVDAMNAILNPKRGIEGYLPPHLEGYERDLSQIAKYLIDLEKM